jgi:hypothetical protein
MPRKAEGLMRTLGMAIAFVVIGSAAHAQMNLRQLEQQEIYNYVRTQQQLQTMGQPTVVMPPPTPVFIYPEPPILPPVRQSSPREFREMLFGPYR